MVLGAKRLLYLASGATAVGLLLVSSAVEINGVMGFGFLVGAGIYLFHRKLDAGQPAGTGGPVW